MRRVTAWIGGVASGVVAYRFWRRHHAPDSAPEPEAPVEPDDRAEELRAKLAETREAAPEPAAEAVVEEPPAAEPVEPEAEVEQPEPEPESPDERRSRVHEEGRTALDEMKSEGQS
jgi:outer membrane biosynthesis protein TonB